jgi:hypothetical protein
VTLCRHNTSSLVGEELASLQKDDFVRR